MSTDLTEVKNLFDEAKKAGWNVLIPETLIVGLADQYALAIAQTTVSTDLADGEIYADDNAAASEAKRYRLHKTALMRISGPYMAGLKWWPKESGIEKHERDYIAFKSVGSILSPDGQEVPFVGHDDLDFIVLEEKYRESYIAKAKKLTKKDKGGERAATDKEKEEYITYCVKRDLMQKREHKLAIVETGAMERVIRGAIGLKNSYSLKQLRKPFITARVILRPDYSNSTTRAQAIESGKQAAKNIFGQDPPIDIPPSTGNSDQKKPDTGNEKGSSSATPVDGSTIDFQNSPPEDQAKTLEGMAKKKGYHLAGWLEKVKKPLVDVAPEKRLELFKHLMSLKDATSAHPAEKR
jgi:hypothetical protein